MSKASPEAQTATTLITEGGFHQTADG